MHTIMLISECTGSSEKWMKARKMLKELKENQMEQKLSKTRILTYHVNWNDSGGTITELFCIYL